MRIGQYQLRNRLIAAPMAGITDRPFRTLCYEMGAGLTVSEMMSSNPQVWESDKSRLRMVHIDEPGIRTVQIAGSDPQEMNVVQDQDLNQHKHHEIYETTQ